jgi:hypothetical protein
MQSIWSKVLGFRIISSQKHIIFMQFFWFLLVGPVTLKKPVRASVQIFLVKPPNQFRFLNYASKAAGNAAALTRSQ